MKMNRILSGASIAMLFAAFAIPAPLLRMISGQPCYSNNTGGTCADSTSDCGFISVCIEYEPGPGTLEPRVECEFYPGEEPPTLPDPEMNDPLIGFLIRPLVVEANSITSANQTDPPNGLKDRKTAESPTPCATVYFCTCEGMMDGDACFKNADSFFDSLVNQYAETAEGDSCNTDE
jgi:hypothetical protein